MNLPADKIELMKEQMKSPIGTVTFEFDCFDLTNRDIYGGNIFEITAGQHAFILQRTKDLNINFYYSSPGTGTSVATIDLKPLPIFTKAFFCLTWSPDKITLSMGPRGIPNAHLISAEGTDSEKKIWVGNDGSIFITENDNIRDVSIYQDGKEILSSTALEAWKNIKLAVEIIGTGKSEEGYIHECVVTNLSLSIMVTGFESYLKKRFLELEDAGIQPNIEALLDSFLSGEEKKKEIDRLIINEAKNTNITTLKYIVKKRKINFQNFDDIKKAFNSGYGLTLKMADIDSRLIVPIRKFLIFRHRIIHVSPLIGLLNQVEVPFDEPVFPNEKLRVEALNIFDEFIQLLHVATLKLSSTD